MKKRSIKTKYGTIKEGDSCPNCKGILYYNFNKILICRECSFMPDVEEAFYKKYKRYPKNTMEENRFFWDEFKE